MSQTFGVQRIFTVVLGASAFALALAVTVPHAHDPSPLSHHAENCRACKIQQSFSATLPSGTMAQLLQTWAATNPLVLLEVPRQASVVRLPSPRAPPASV